VALIFVALLGSWGAISANSKRTTVLVAAHQLAAGTVLSRGDLRSAELGGDSAVVASIVPERELPQTLGRRLSAPVPAGSPLASAALTAPASQTATMTLAVPEFDVTGPSLQAGESVGVLATFGAGTGQASARVVARGLRVVAVGEAAPNADPSTATIPVTVALSSQSIASSLALADQDAKLDLLLEGGGQPSTAPIPQASQTVGR
jgi:Flp pilus assembly protein CpaB